MSDKDFMISILGFATAIFIILMLCAVAFGIATVNSL